MHLQVRETPPADKLAKLFINNKITNLRFQSASNIPSFTYNQVYYGLNSWRLDRLKYLFF